ncbi:MAG: ribosome biogenesis GTPase Der, partial [Bacteroidales bacterium]|nr:ribosome biogenesis GTPase Der [Bacteroidales bacterium]
TMKNFTKDILQKIAPFTDVPIIFTSVINKQRIVDVLKHTMQVYENYTRKIDWKALNDAMMPEIEAHQPPLYRGNEIKIKYITQLSTRVPSFAFFCNHPQHIKEPYKRFLENRLREHFNFTGCPVNIYFKEKK